MRIRQQMARGLSILCIPVFVGRVDGVSPYQHIPELTDPFMRLSLVSALVAALTLGATVAQAAEPIDFLNDRVKIGKGRSFNNDVLGDGKDRWRTGSYTTSRIYGYSDWSGPEDRAFGDIIELRIRGEIIAPADLVTPDAGDRRWASSLSFGAHTHFAKDSTEFALGTDLVFVGPQTGLAGVQRIIHEIVDAPIATVLDDQVENAVYLAVSGEVARPVALGSSAMLRPFATFRAGEETFARAGADLIIGSGMTEALLIRDVTTGQLYRGATGGGAGMSYVLGADYGYVADSAFLDADDGYDLTHDRLRVRAGALWQGESGASVFYGATYLSEEFDAQPEGQVVGTLRLDLKF